MPIEVAKLRAERDEARDWLAKANNEFGSQTWSWPNLWQRIAQLKELSNERWKRAVSAEDELAALRKAAGALAFANARLLQRVRETSADKWMPHAADAADAALATYRTTKEAKE
jgi:hypothetical protein